MLKGEDIVYICDMLPDNDYKYFELFNKPTHRP